LEQIANVFGQYSFVEHRCHVLASGRWMPVKELFLSSGELATRLDLPSSKWNVPTIIIVRNQIGKSGEFVWNILVRLSRSE